MRQNENFEEQLDSSLVARKVAVHVQLNKKNTGKTLGKGFLKYTFLCDNKISVTNDCWAVCREKNFSRIQNFATRQNVLVINRQTFFYIFNFLSLTLDKTILRQSRKFGSFIFLLYRKERKG